LGGIENVSERAATAQKIFGKSAADLIPVLLAQSGEFEASMNAAAALGAVVSEEGAAGIAAMNDAVGRVSLGFEGMANQVAVAVAPLVESIASTLAGWIPPVIELANQWLPTIVDSAAAMVGFATDLYLTMYKVATLDFSGAFETATNALGEQGTAAQLILKVQEARNRAAEVANENARRNAEIKAATLAIEEDGLKTEEAKASEGEKIIAQLERKLAIAERGAEAVEREEQLNAAVNLVELERIANLQQQLGIQEKLNEAAKERVKEEERLTAERERRADEVTRDAEDRERQIAGFRPGGDAVESRLLTRGSAESSGDKLVKLTEKTLEVLRQLLSTTQGQDPAASNGGITLEYMS
jgi:hypothetical protein